jgi:hypothetical protein
MQMSEDITKLAAALVKAQGAMDGAKKDAKNDHFKNRYATLEAVIDAVKPALNANGIAYLQMPEAVIDGAVEIETMLVHETGQWLRSVLHVPLGKRDAQGIGSAVSYGRRYALMAICGIPAEDDDGNAASASEPKRQAKPAAVAAEPAPDPDHAEVLISRARSMDELADLWRTPWIVSIVKQAPLEIVNRITAAKDARKAELAQGIAA